MFDTALDQSTALLIAELDAIIDRLNPTSPDLPKFRSLRASLAEVHAPELLEVAEQPAWARFARPDRLN